MAKEFIRFCPWQRSTISKPGYQPNCLGNYQGKPLLTILISAISKSFRLKLLAVGSMLVTTLKSMPIHGCNDVGEISMLVKNFLYIDEYKNLNKCWRSILAKIFPYVTYGMFVNANPRLDKDFRQHTFSPTCMFSPTLKQSITDAGDRFFAVKKSLR